MSNRRKPLRRLLPEMLRERPRRPLPSPRVSKSKELPRLTKPEQKLPLKRLKRRKNNSLRTKRKKRDT